MSLRTAKPFLENDPEKFGERSSFNAGQVRTFSIGTIFRLYPQTPSLVADLSKLHASFFSTEASNPKEDTERLKEKTISFSKALFEGYKSLFPKELLHLAKLRFVTDKTYNLTFGDKELRFASRETPELGASTIRAFNFVLSYDTKALKATEYVLEFPIVENRYLSKKSLHEQAALEILVTYLKRFPEDIKNGVIKLIVPKGNGGEKA